MIKQLSLSSALVCFAMVSAAPARGEAVKYVRYTDNDAISYGILEGGTIRQLEGGLFDDPKPTGETAALADVRLLAPCVPSKVIAVGLNYKSHLGNAEPSKEPPLFAKLPTCIVGPGDNIILPEGSSAVHFEAELVIVIGKKAKNVPEEEALDYVFGVTCGNDVSGRAWQGADLQWFRAKASDTFGPIGPAILTGVDYDDLQLEGRLNGKTVQEQTTGDLLHGTARIVSFTSQYVTLMPGDVIFTGTPGRTSSLKPGDVFEVELEGVGILSNPVVAAADVEDSAMPDPSGGSEASAADVIAVLDLNKDGKIAKQEILTIFTIIDSNGDDIVDEAEAEMAANFLGGSR